MTYPPLCGRLSVRRTDCGVEAVSDLRRREFITLLGGAAAWPLAARAQQPAMPVIGFLSSGSPAAYANRVAAFRNGLGERDSPKDGTSGLSFGGQKVDTTYLPALAAELVSRNVAVIVSSGGDATSGFAKAATFNYPDRCRNRGP